MVTSIKNFPSAKYPEIIRKINQIFIKIFKLVYEIESIDRNQYIWIWLICSFSVNLFIGLILNLFRIIIPLENLLVYLLIVPSALVIVSFYAKTKGLLSTFLFASLMVLSVYITFFFMGFDLQNTNLSFTILALSFPLSIFIGIYFIKFLIKHDKSFFYISPPRVIFTSILTMIIIALIKKDIAQTFISDFNQIGMILLAFLLLNIFADSISLWETNIILRLAVKGTTRRFVFLGLLDLILSTFIFLAIPLSTGNLDIFLESMLFKGDKPWLGILFWSTFSTSILFWAFLLAIFGETVLKKVLRHYIKLNKILPIEEKPITCIYIFAIVIIMPFMFLIT